MDCSDLLRKNVETYKEQAKMILIFTKLQFTFYNFIKAGL